MDIESLTKKNYENFLDRIVLDVEKNLILILETHSRILGGFAANYLAKKELSTLEHPDLHTIVAENKLISVDSIRYLGQRLNRAPSLAKRQVVIINSLDDLSISGANALLKSMEEPNSKLFMILLTENLENVMPTIKSRCYKIKIPILSPNIIQQQTKLSELQSLAASLFFMRDLPENAVLSAWYAGDFSTSMADYYNNLEQISLLIAMTHNYAKKTTNSGVYSIYHKFLNAKSALARLSETNANLLIAEMQIIWKNFLKGQT